MLVRDTTLLPPLQAALGSAAIPFGAAVLMCANALLVIGSCRLARTWSAAQLSDTGNTRRLVFLVVLVLGMVIAIPSTMSDARSALEGDWTMIPNMASRFGDIFSLALVGPVVVTARALRGGTLTWIWTLLAAALVSWVAFDVSLLGDFVHHPERRAVVELFRALACGFTMAAGFAQRQAIVPVLEAAGAD